MTVKSARVQSIIKGDDVTLKHQLVKKTTLDVEFTNAKVELAVTDKVTFFYELEDGVDLIGFDGTNAEAYPTSRFNSVIAGEISGDPVRGSSTFKEGLGLTVRAEVIRDFATTPKKETYYLMEEVDVIERGFPVEEKTLNLP